MTIGPFQTSRIQRKIGPADRRLLERRADVGVRHRSIWQDDVGEVHQPAVADEAGEPSWPKQKLMHVGQHRPRVARQQLLRAVPEVALAQSGHRRVDRDEERRWRRLSSRARGRRSRRHVRRPDRAGTTTVPSFRLRPRRRGSPIGSRACRPSRLRLQRPPRRLRRAGRTSGCCRPARAQRAARGPRRAPSSGDRARGRHGTARPEQHIVENPAVFAERHLAISAAVDVVEGNARQAAFGQPAKVGDVEDTAGNRLGSFAKRFYISRQSGVGNRESQSTVYADSPSRQSESSVRVVRPTASIPQSG